MIACQLQRSLGRPDEEGDASIFVRCGSGEPQREQNVGFANNPLGQTVAPHVEQKGGGRRSWMVVVIPTNTAMGAIMMIGKPHANMTPKNRTAPRAAWGRHQRSFRERLWLKRK